MAFGNVKVNYKPCKSVGQLKASVDYMLGKKLDQRNNGIVKTAPDLYTALGCERDNFANNVLMTRKLQGKSYTRLKEKEILAHKMSISFHPDDNNRLNYRMAFEIAKNFAERFSHSKGHEVLFAVYTDTKHIHVHFLISNCNMNTGKSYRRNKKDLYEMSKYFGEQCLEYGLTNSVRENFYNHDLEQAKDRVCLAEKRMKERGGESFKDELREVVQQEVADPKNKTFEDVIRGLKNNWNVETRVAGNTVSYKHPEYKDKNNNLVSVRGSKLGELYTVKGINHELNKKHARTAEQQQSERTEFVNSATGITAIMGTDIIAERNRQSERRGQIQGDITSITNGENVPNLDRFYDRYTKRVEEDEQRANEALESARKVQPRRKSLSL